MPNYHLCYTSHDEVLFRNEADMNTAFNSLCSALCKTDSSCFAFTNMSDHHHGCYATKKPDELLRIARESYTIQFNNKYYRVGPLGERGIYAQEISGLKHFIAAVSYTLKNAPHHGVTSSPFEYKYSSANAYFRKQLGKNRDQEIRLSPEQIKATLPRRAAFLPEWEMGVDGVFFPETVVDVQMVENAFSTVQTFNYYMGRKSGEDWKKEQAEENDLDPFTLNNMEKPFLQKENVSVADLLRNEKSRFTTAPITDLELCSIIDEQYVPKYDRLSVYHLKRQEKNDIANELNKQYHANRQQIIRCLVMR